MKPCIEIVRLWQDANQTSGICTIYTHYGFPLFTALSLERGWQGNQNNISCVPIGEYKLEFEYSPRFDKKLWELKDVPNRSECKFHSSNYWYQLNGCIALGRSNTKLNGDNYYDVTNSKNTMKAFESVLSDYTELTLKIKGINDIQ